MGSKKNGEVQHHGIHAFIHMGDAKSVEKILEIDPSQAMMEMTGANTLYHAGSKGRLDIVKIIVEKHPSMIKLMTGPSGYRAHPLYGAAIEGHLPVVKYLVEAGADVNCIAEDGGSCLIMAVQYNHLDIMTYLLDHQANIDYERPGGRGTALHLAIITESYRRASPMSPPSPVFLLLLARGANMELTIKNDGDHSPMTALRMALGCDFRLSMELYASGALLENIHNNSPLNEREKSTYELFKKRSKTYIQEQCTAIDAKNAREAPPPTAPLQPNISPHLLSIYMKARCNLVDCEFSKGTGNVGEFSLS